jgi:hypothetical protein
MKKNHTIKRFKYFNYIKLFNDWKLCDTEQPFATESIDFL